ncbi:MAG: FUSC family protein [Lachnospiraceae bacterium]|nr:FUSC family protein [Lachnospiraceae bacterium]
MTFYQELQLDQAGSKSYIASFQDPKDKLKHIGIYLFKVILNVAFCTAFIILFSMIFGPENSVAGLSVLLCIMAFRCVDLGIRTSHGVVDILIVFGILAAGPKVSGMLPAGWAFCANLIFIMFLLILGCHNVIMFNHATLVLAYLLLQGYDVSGEAFHKRLIGLSIGAVLTAVIFYYKHRNQTYKRTFSSLFKEFDLSSARTKWQLRFTFTISSILLIGTLLDIPKTMWLGIAAMSVCVPFRNDIGVRVKYRILGNVMGGIIFIAAYLILPKSAVAYFGMFGGICVGLSASYGWQAAFNAFSALAIATPVFGMPYAVLFRVFNNVFSAVYTWLFDRLFEPVIPVCRRVVDFIGRKLKKDMNVME